MFKGRPEAFTERFNPFSKIWMKLLKWKGSFAHQLVGFETDGFVLAAAAGRFSTFFFLTAFGAIAGTSAVPSKKLDFQNQGPGCDIIIAQVLKPCTAVMNPAISGNA